MKYEVGDVVVFQEWKASTNPSHQAKDPYPSHHGDMYTYQADSHGVIQAQAIANFNGKHTHNF